MPFLRSRFFFVFLFTLSLLTQTAFAESVPSRPDETVQITPPPADTVGTPVDLSKPIELKMDLPTSPESQPLPTSATLVQTDISTLPGAPAFLKDVKTKEDFDKLTDEQKKEAEVFFIVLNSGPDGAPVASTESAQETLPNTVNCFDYYRFGSVQADLSHITGSSVSGSQATFAGTVQNTNTYPIVDGAVYVKIFRLPETGGTPVQGYNVVDQFFAKEGIDIPAQGSIPLSYTWNVPAYLPSGTYQAAYFYTSAHKFNLLGLSFTDDVVGNTSTFTVSGEVAESVYFDKEGVTVDGNKYFFAAFTPKLDKDKAITATTTLVNNTSEPQNVPVTWKVYKWDAQQEENRIDTKTETISLEAKEEKVLAHTVTDKSGSVYLVIAEAQYQDTKSILNIRFTRKGVPTTRINFPALTTYPLTKDTQTTLFSCLHSAGTLAVVPNGKLVLTLTDKQGNVIHTYTYEGGVTGNMMGVKSDFTPTKDYDIFTLKAELYRDNALVDTAEMKYDCRALNGGNCAQDETVSVFPEKWGDLTVIKVGVALFLTIILFGALVVVRRAKRKSSGTGPTSAGGMGMMVFFLLFAGSMCVGVGEVGAASVTSSVTPAIWANYGSGYLTYAATVGYNANIRDGAWNVIAQGTSVPVGTWIYFEAGYGGISWYVTGFESDSPYGAWVNQAGAPPSVQAYNNVPGYNWVSYQSSVTVHPAGSSLNTTGTTAGLTYMGYQNAAWVGWYRVDSAGSINAKFNFNATYANYYDGWGYSMITGLVEGSSNAIPAASIQYNITAYNPNTAPNAPTITGAGGITGQSLPFTITGTDPNGDQVRYLVDWDNNGTGDQWVPASGLVNSGTAQTTNRAWATAGSKTFKALAQDSKGTNSGWTSHTITITNAPVNGSCNPATNGQTFDVRPTTNLCTTGTLAWTDTNALDDGIWGWNCNGLYGGTPASCSAFLTFSASIQAKVNTTGVWTSGSVTANEDSNDRVALKWSTIPSADSCTISGFGTARIYLVGTTTSINGTLGSSGTTELTKVNDPIKGNYTVACTKSGRNTSNTVNVNVVCTPTGWSGWGSCTKECDGGTQNRTKKRADCGYDVETRPCNTQVCHPDGFEEVAP